VVVDFDPIIPSLHPVLVALGVKIDEQEPMIRMHLPGPRSHASKDTLNSVGVLCLLDRSSRLPFLGIAIVLKLAPSSGFFASDRSTQLESMQKAVWRGGNLGLRQEMPGIRGLVAVVHSVRRRVSFCISAVGLADFAYRVGSTADTNF
jgi:hypothetical protein